MLVKAVITTRWGDKGYKPADVVRVEDFFVDTAIDTDADQWAISFADFDHKLVDVLERDNEVRVDIMAFPTAKNPAALQKGFADEIVKTTDGKLVITGRDLSAVAVDSQHDPQKWSHVKPSKFVVGEVHDLKMGATLKLDSVKPFPTLFTDGSESFWELWYRMYRKRERWIWLDPRGIMYATTLNYKKAPAYRFGVSPDNSLGWIRVEQAEWRKVTTTRVGKATVLGHNGQIGFSFSQPDKSIAQWIKKPHKIITSATASNQAECKAEAIDEIFDSKVGSLEWTFTIEAQNEIIRQNEMADVNIPSLGLRGQFFIVGSKIVGNLSEGMVQDVRLREAGFALPKRKPDDPELATPQNLQPGATDALGSLIGVTGKDAWMQFFIRAANDNHGAWPIDLFLATLLAICDVESSFQNEREPSGGPEWYPPPEPHVPNYNQKIREWRDNFANDPGSPGNPYSRDAGVGPMQLTTHGYKLDADNMAPSKSHDEFMGGRWVPEYNIREGGAVLKSKLGSLPVTDANFWAGVQAYNGTGSAAVAYMQKVKSLVDSIYLPAVKAANDATTAPGDLPANASGGGGEPLWGGSKELADVFMRIALSHGLSVVSSKRSDRNTTGGGISDHWTGALFSYAYDLGNSANALTGPPTDEEDAACGDILKALGQRYKGGTVIENFYPNKQFRVQVIWRTPLYGGHMGHIHLGVRRTDHQDTG